MRILLICLFCLLPATLSAQTNQPSGTIDVEDSATQDAAIANRIRGILAELDGYDDVTVSVTSGIVTLRGHTLDGESARRLNDLASRVQGVVAIENEVTETTDVVERLNPAIDRIRSRATQAIAFVPILTIAIGVFALVVFLGYALASRRNPWDRMAPNPFIADIMRQVVRLAFVMGGIVIALDILGATALLSTILGAAGIAGLAIGFAVRDTVENFIASILLSIRQPFRPNDTIEIDGDIGKVIRLTSRATILLSYDGNHIRIPNATVFKARIINYTLNDQRRFLFELGVAPDCDLALARDTAVATLNGLPFVLREPPPEAWVETVGDSTVTLQVAGWIAQQETSFALARGEAIRLTMLALTQASISMPEPTFRILGPGSKPPAGPEAPRSIPEQPVPENVTASADQALEKFVAEERAAQGEEDLLSDDAKRE